MFLIHNNISSFRSHVATDDLGHFYRFIFLHDLGLRMIGVFAPIHLYLLGYGLPLVIGFFLVGNIIYLISRTTISRMIVRFGVRRAILVSNITWIGFVLAVLSLEPVVGQLTINHHLTLILLSAIYHFSLMIYYSSHDYYMNQAKKPKSIGKNVSTAMIWGMIGSFLGPLIGGILSQKYGFNLTLVLGSSLLLVSLAMLATIRDEDLVRPAEQSKKYINMKQYRQMLRIIDKRQLLVEVVSLQFLKLGLYWPLYIGLVIFANNPYSGIGILAAVTAIVSTTTCFGVGRLVDRGHSRLIMKGSALMEFVMSLSRFFVTTPIGAIIHNIVWQTRHGHRVVVSKWFYQTNDIPADKIICFQDTIQIVRHLAAAVVSATILVLVILAPPAEQLNMIRYFCIGFGPLAAVFLLFDRPKRTTHRLQSNLNS